MVVGDWVFIFFSTLKKLGKGRCECSKGVQSVNFDRSFSSELMDCMVLMIKPHFC